METPSVAEDSFVSFTYAVFEQGQSEPVDAIDPDEPVEYVHGYGQILPILEKSMLGRKAGDKLTIEAGPDEAFGSHEAEGVFEVEREGLDVEDPKVGDELHAKDGEGHVLVLRIVELRGETILVDANHPLAGKQVRFDVEVVSVRAATDEEIDVAQQEVEEMAAAEHDGCCGHDHSHDGHDHGHDHDHGAEAAPPLVKIGRRGTA